ncbi:hypothetical protein CLIB1423_09S04214 [[Candida] railenensis]|uniref:WKF domain-containing protein n=1 Tax=[Candida] railenensis TaxID=45579 RepID=A0A9P0QQQ7_9ASCO|nr:hypothetical protein CLIB1423_09S04214 [[Candida] railenensis]
MSVPAWKKIGLKIKEQPAEVEDQSLSITHLESSTITNKQAKKLNKQKRKAELETSGDKKPPKRVKIPKSERGPPPVKDQFVYLQQYHTDKDNWKFSKQKQNWILKNIRNIPDEYESALVAYIEGIQGGSRDRVIEDLKKVVQKWNDIQAVAEAKVMAELERKRNGASKKVDEDKEDEEKDEKKKTSKEIKEATKKKAQEQEEEAPPDVEYAKRCRILIKALSDEVVELNGVEDEEDEDVEDVEEQQEEEAATETNEPVEDNLIFDTVEVSGFPEEFEAAKNPNGKGTSKKDKKSKKKKSKSKSKAKPISE